MGVGEPFVNVGKTRKKKKKHKPPSHAYILNPKNTSPNLHPTLTQPPQNSKHKKKIHKKALKVKKKNTSTEPSYLVRALEFAPNFSMDLMPDRCTVRVAGLGVVLRVILQADEVLDL